MITASGDDRRMVVIGAGGHAKVVIDVARAAGWSPHVALDPGAIGTHCAGIEVVGPDDMASALFAQGLRYAVVAIGNNDVRLRIGIQLQALGFQCPALVHPSAVVSPFAVLADGAVVMPQVAINSHAIIGAFAIVNSGAIVEHDCQIGSGAHVAPRSVLGGNVVVGSVTLFGIGAVARPGSRIGCGATIGAGAVVVGHIADNQTVVGSPARAHVRLDIRE
jgi:UDP-perosamine 4-acetyltransferase